jgi:hypothetical protein
VIATFVDHTAVKRKRKTDKQSSYAYLKNGRRLRVAGRNDGARQAVTSSKRMKDVDKRHAHLSVFTANDRREIAGRQSRKNRRLAPIRRSQTSNE